MMRCPLLGRILSGWADAVLESSVTQLELQLASKQAELDAANRIIAVRDAEIQQLAAVVARNIARVKAETDSLAKDE